MNENMRKMVSFDDKYGEDENVFTLDVTSLVPAIDPSDYFITSGEAVKKAEKLEHDIWEAAGKARKLKNLLKRARHKAEYLEVSWEGGVLVLRRKNPRKKRRATRKEEPTKST